MPIHPEPYTLHSLTFTSYPTISGSKPSTLIWTRYFKRIMRVLLYLLDKGCDGAGMGCAPRYVLVAAAAARSRGGASYEPEKNGAGLQVEMLLQVDVAFVPLVCNLCAVWLLD